MYLWGEFDEDSAAPRELYGMGSTDEWKRVGIPSSEKWVGSADNGDETYELPPTRDEVKRIARAVEVDVGGTRSDARKLIDWMKGS